MINYIASARPGSIVLSKICLEALLTAQINGGTLHRKRMLVLQFSFFILVIASEKQIKEKAIISDFFVIKI